MRRLATTSELNVWQVSMQSQLKHGGQSGKRIGHLILLPRNMVEGYVIEELFQLLDGGLVGYQLMIPSLPFSP